MFFTLMSCRRPDMRIYFICKPQRLTRKIKAHIRRDSVRGSKTLRVFYCFCYILIYNVRWLNEKELLGISPYIIRDFIP